MCGGIRTTSLDPRWAVSFLLFMLPTAGHQPCRMPVRNWSHTVSAQAENADSCYVNAGTAATFLQYGPEVSLAMLWLASFFSVWSLSCYMQSIWLFFKYPDGIRPLKGT